MGSGRGNVYFRHRVSHEIGFVLNMKATTNETREKMPFSLHFVVFLRSLSLQASWNTQRMQNLGLLITVLPWLHRRPRSLQDDRRFCRRYFGFFNTNPYLANFVIGGLIRLENDRTNDVEVPEALITMFRDSLGRTFASLGDQLFWLGVRPALTMAICLLGMHGWMIPILVLVGIFAFYQLGMRWWALGRGYGLGMDIVELLDHPHWHRGIKWSKRVGMFLAGMLGACYLGKVQGIVSSQGGGLVWAGVLLGFGIPFVLRKRLPGEAILVLTAVLAFVLSFAI